MNTILEQSELETLHQDEWMRIYHYTRMSECGVTQEEFLNMPWEYLVRNGQETCFLAQNNGFLPLLPTQARVAITVRNLDIG